MRTVLARIADDEARHAALAWRTLRWALEHDGARLSAIVESAFDRSLARLSTLSDSDASDLTERRRARAHPSRVETGRPSKRAG